MTLNKLQIRTIQTINSGTLSTTDTSKKFDTIYIANPSSFYIANNQDVDTPLSKAVQNGEALKLSFKDEVVCKGKGKIIVPSDEDFEDTALFFSIDPSKINHIILFDIESIDSKA